ncbi:hypothetical protein HYG86_02885 [Alkalicella caledoniensis]|uniref:Uncharacterized protein n=1 Tax=Alkalicella caledoniensis TaxID=2731377 RepID=A0A7G9W517_ALKCA|nr:hypothetical protein [Alkalicella caledoniensis]QNO13779.1 hypothetical protein HYG86_02885 [Alkalicella caledoniensis]
MFIKVIMLFLLVIAGTSFTFQGLTLTVQNFHWTSLVEVIAIFILMVLFPCIYLITFIRNYRLWKFTEIDKLLSVIKEKVEPTKKSKEQGIKVIKKNKEFFISEVTGLHTFFIFAFYRKERIETTDIQRVKEISDKKQNKNVLFFCTGHIDRTAKDYARNLDIKFVFEDYRYIGDFNIKKYFVAPQKKTVKNS